MMLGVVEKLDCFGMDGKNVGLKCGEAWYNGSCNSI